MRMREGQKVRRNKNLASAASVNLYRHYKIIENLLLIMHGSFLSVGMVRNKLFKI